MESEDFDPWEFMPPILITIEDVLEPRGGSYEGTISKVTKQKVFNDKKGMVEAKPHIFFSDGYFLLLNARPSSRGNRRELSYSLRLLWRMTRRLFPASCAPMENHMY